MSDPVLLPRPRHLAAGAGSIDAVEASSIDVAHAAGLRPEGYRLAIDGDGVHAEAADPAGAAHLHRTLSQLRMPDGRWPHVRIDDYPDLAVRGVMLDVSRDKVPTMATLLALVDQLAAWKYNHLQLYVEHTFTHRGHEVVWRDASPFTTDEIETIDRHCRERHVELVPNQNLLGHMERFLVHPAYRHMAIEPDGFRWLGFLPRTPSTLDPRRDDAFELVSGLVGGWVDALPDAPRFHIGLDEPWELGDDLLPDYAAWLTRLRSLPALAGREVLMWGDILAGHPELMEAVPEGVSVCEWGYEADHPWQERLVQLADAGLPRWVCPGTSSWDSLLGRTTNMVGSIGGAVDAALADGSIDSMLLTDWGDWGHLQYLPVSLPGFAWGASQSWCRNTNRDLDLAAALDAHAAEATGPGWGAAIMGLGDAHLGWAFQVPNIASCFLQLWMTQLPVSRADPSHASAVRDRMGAAQRLGDVGDELRTSVDLAELLLDDAVARMATDDGRIGSVPEGVRRPLADRMDAVIDAHRAHWMARNRPGGLDDSVAWLTRVGDAYRTGEVAPEWLNW
jgi:hexosaminidase